MEQKKHQLMRFLKHIRVPTLNIKNISHYLKGLPGSEALLGELFATSDADVLGAAVSRYFERLQDDEQGLG